MEHTYRLVISCPDGVGIVAKVSNFLSTYNGWITEASHHSDTHSGWFFMRHEIIFDPTVTTKDKLQNDFKAIAPQYVVMYRKGNKHDYNDAQAIAEASQREEMRFVPLKSQNQQDIQMVHRTRERLIGQRTAVSNQIRGLLAEYGIANLPNVICINI